MALSLVGRLGLEPLEKLAQRLELLLAETFAEELLDVREMVARRFFELVVPRSGQACVDDARVALARGLLDVPAALEAVEETRDPRGGEQDLLRETDPPHRAIWSPRQTDQDLGG